MVDVVQSVRTSDCGSEGRRFKSGLPPTQKNLLNQSVEKVFYLYFLKEPGNSFSNTFQ
jgi:hypothetical protein